MVHKDYLFSKEGWLRHFINVAIASVYSFPQQKCILKILSTLRFQKQFIFYQVVLPFLHVSFFTFYAASLRETSRHLSRPYLMGNYVAATGSAKFVSSPEKLGPPKQMSTKQNFACYALSTFQRNNHVRSPEIGKQKRLKILKIIQ